MYVNGWTSAKDQGTPAIGEPALRMYVASCVSVLTPS
jgi:hypothetical protein